MVKVRQAHASMASRRSEVEIFIVIGIWKIQEFNRHRVKFSTAAKLTHAR
jgi:hypothetical protein